ncbi:MAG: type IV pilus biogenesis/stability protein PilW [Gammaproteobacteria bacterium]|nr:type IV pilus biogenesis/stability protein PilW [Gammaproteobacteria bacterium]MBU2678111.1 type IV pilus biogenesis/stability protein PilW [Gammaproteobacteria bacterium]NNC56159.1 type IV pilus biogenesis/stability protein PilW [Woeseiaceae bacterium]NNL51846.1 type IV pilus biogenesis/stability protein PilW [Woeseiaceae bacterium]
MKNINLILPIGTCLLLLAGCISTTTGPAPKESNDADAAELNYQLGARYYQNGNFELARDRLLLSLKFNPQNAMVHSTLALTYEALGNLRLARESYEQAVRAGPRNFDVQNTYAVFLCNQREFEAARKSFEKAASHPENDNGEVTLTNAGVCMVQKPDLVAAERLFRLALDRKSNYAEALLQMCLLKYTQEDYLGSRAFLQRFVGTSKSTPAVLYLGAMIEEKLGDSRARQEYVDQLLRDFPTSQEARKILETG